ncbi:MAG TPA: DUF2914 domain-containing protein [Nitrospiraceae bacterium]|nr:DUF2914 domain-containing protein [Nitrospiraceae bacterium]
MPVLLFKLVMLACAASFLQGFGIAYAVTDLTLIDASFASRVVGREPARVSQSLRVKSLTDSRLWFWVHVSCTGACEQKIARKGHVKIFLDWYLEEEGILKKQTSLPLSVKASTWRTWAVKEVKAGAWVVVVRAEDSQWVCLKDRCDFAIKIK